MLNVNIEDNTILLSPLVTLDIFISYMLDEFQIAIPDIRMMSADQFLVSLKLRLNRFNRALKLSDCEHSYAC